MNNNWFVEKKNNFLTLIVSVLVVAVSFAVNINFREDFFRKFSESIFWLFVPILIYSLILLIVSKDIFISWFKFTLYFIITSIIIVLFTPTTTHGLDFFPIVKETVTIFLASIYSVISIIVITIKSISIHNKEKKRN